MTVGPHLEKFNIVSNDHGRTQKCDICVSIGKTNFTDHHTPYTIKGFRDSVLVCKMHDCTVLYDTQKFKAFPFLLISPSHRHKFSFLTDLLKSYLLNSQNPLAWSKFFVNAPWVIPVFQDYYTNDLWWYLEELEQ